jgi:poly(A) polymerase
MAANGQYLGVTEPISIAGPTEMDCIKTRELEKFLVSAGLYESQEEAVRREEVLGRLDQIVKSWVKQISRNKGFNEQLVQEANAKIFTFGSYRLGVHGPGADIDTLCVGPHYATREVMILTSVLVSITACDICMASLLHVRTVRSQESYICISCL